MLKRNKIILITVSLIVVVVSSTVLVYFLVIRNNDLEPQIKGGIVSEDETWSGDIFVNESIVVDAGVTLTLLPGTKLFFSPNRDYKSATSTGLAVNGGTIIAVGTAEERIWFTSDADSPINGDWAGIEIHDSDDSVFDFVIIEFAMMGIAQYDSSVAITHSIVRWVNLEGIYMEGSNPLIEYNLLYQNGYHEISLEQRNYDVVVRNNIFAGGNVPFITLDSNVTIEGNYFYNYNKSDTIAISVAGLSNATITGNKFDGFTNDTAYKILVPTATMTLSNNDLGGGTVPIPDIGFEDIKQHDLGYTPGDPEDLFNYVYELEDETRRVIKRIGQGLGFGWAMTYANGYLWKMDTEELVQIDPVAGNYTRHNFSSYDILWPSGLCYDGEYFFVLDQTFYNITKFKFNGTHIVTYDSFRIPEYEAGGRVGLATDGTYLYIASRDGGTLYELNKNGTIHNTISITHIDLTGGFTWNGTHFWSAKGLTLTAWTKEGTIVGSIYDVAVGITSLTFDGTHLWGLYKTCETWNDNKIFQIEVIDDSIL